MKLWGGRFFKEPDSLFSDFTSSLSFDRWLFREEIEVDLAWVRALYKAGILSVEEKEKLQLALRECREEMEKGLFNFLPTDEDIHTAIERRLQEKVGDLGGKLHTGRSRNDLAVTVLRLFLKRKIAEVNNLIFQLLKAILKRAREEKEIIMPAYTHLQPAQPVLFAHYLMAYFWMIKRDFDRLVSCNKKMDYLPLGSAAATGTPYPIDRESLAKELGFAHLSDNSVDAVSDRDFVVHFLSQISILMMHLSRLAEELILWSTEEFGYIELDDAYTTGSSVMPQKKNPDAAELVRGKAGRVFGHLFALLTTLKGLPLSYNRDLQEDKEGLFDALEVVEGSLQVMKGMIETLKIKKESFQKALERGFLEATEAADYLVGKGVNFRQAHEIVGKVVSYALEQNKTLTSLSLDEWRRFSSLFEDDLFEFISLKAALNRRNVYGGTSPEALKVQLEQAEKIIKRQEEWLKEHF